jgi:hypothetical protein
MTSCTHRQHSHQCNRTIASASHHPKPSDMDDDLQSNNTIAHFKILCRRCCLSTKCSWRLAHQQLHKTTLTTHSPSHVHQSTCPADRKCCEIDPLETVRDRGDQSITHRHHQNLHVRKVHAVILATLFGQQFLSQTTNVNTGHPTSRASNPYASCGCAGHAVCSRRPGSSVVSCMVSNEHT